MQKSAYSSSFFVCNYIFLPLVDFVNLGFKELADEEEMTKPCYIIYVELATFHFSLERLPEE